MKLELKQVHNTTCTVVISRERMCYPKPMIKRSSGNSVCLRSRSGWRKQLIRYILQKHMISRRNFTRHWVRLRLRRERIQKAMLLRWLKKHIESMFSDSSWINRFHQGSSWFRASSIWLQLIDVERCGYADASLWKPFRELSKKQEKRRNRTLCIVFKEFSEAIWRGMVMKTLFLGLLGAKLNSNSMFLPRKSRNGWKDEWYIKESNIWPWKFPRFRPH